MKQGLINLSKLAYSPPAQSSPTEVTASTGTFLNQSFEGTADAILKFPASTRTAKTKVVGGKNLRMIGGKVKLGTGETGGLIQITETTKSVFLEGLHLDANENNIDILEAGGSGAEPYTNKPDIYIQNCRFENIIGSQATEHADIYQPQPAIGNLYVDKFTGRSGYQGFFLSPQKPIASVRMSRVNLTYGPASEENPTTYLLWFMEKEQEQAPYPVYLEEVYITPRSGQNLAEHCVWPKKGEKNSKGEAIGAVATTVGGRNAVEFPAASNIHGYVLEGPPPNGDFVKESEVGLSYTSPGYL